jgi:hypothetical protein
MDNSALCKKMITLFKGSGSSSYWASDLKMNPEEWLNIRRAAIRLLAKRGHHRAADLLEALGFEIRKGENDFGDEFDVLYKKVDLDEYVKFESYSTTAADREAFKEIAKTITEIGSYIRFIGVELIKNNDPSPVKHPSITSDSAAVERALIDAEKLIHSSGPISAVDRTHTALHGYLKALCRESSLATEEEDLKINDALKRLRERHPSFVHTTGHDDSVFKILRTMGAIGDALNPMRNHGSIAHPNENLLDEAEAMLAINAARTILSYVHTKTKNTKS